jgi:sugar transferase (PEP-CTERM/EpsH1 system associated)
MTRGAAVERFTTRVDETEVGVPQLLVLTHRVPFPPDKGDRIRTYHMIKYLSKHADVHLACLADEPVHSDARSTLRHYCKRVGIIPICGRKRRVRAGLSLLRGRTATEGVFSEPALASLLRTWTRETRFHSALVSTSGLSRYFRSLRARGIPLIVDMVDVDSEKWFDYARCSPAPQSWFYRIEGARLRRLEGEIAGWADGVTFVSESEARLFRRLVRADRPVHAVTNGVDLEYFRPVAGSAPEDGSCVFIGALDYKPNVDGVSWFCREVWPDVRAEIPWATMSIVGRRPVARVQQLGRLPGVRVLGQVPDVRPFLADASLVVVPLRLARGIQNKVLEAMAMGKAVVASAEAIDGLGVDPRTDLICARTADQWVDSVCEMLKDSERRARVNDAARRFTVQRHQWDSTLGPLLDVLQLPGS